MCRPEPLVHHRSPSTPVAVSDSRLLEARLDAVCTEGWAYWEHFDRTVRERDFHPFIAADYDVVRAALANVSRSSGADGRRFLEWGSASGVITVMADVLGFEAYGIELDASLVRTAQALATRHHSQARFVAGSYLPTGYRWKNGGKDRGSTRNTDKTGDGPSGYLQLGLALDDFDVVFGYPWNGESDMMLDLMRQYGRRDALLLLHDTNDGVRAYRGGRPTTDAQ